VAAPAPQPAGQSWHGNGGHGHGDRDDRGDRHNDRDRRDDRGRSDRGRYEYDRRVDRGRPGNGNRFYGMHDRGRHEGWYHRGGRMPVEYRVTRYYVPDYRVYHLRQPPRGYRWVRSDNGDFLMVAIATGIIANIILAGNCWVADRRPVAYALPGALFLSPATPAARGKPGSSPRRVATAHNSRM
jgi:Ni/Co efflux regulator RcnB